MISQPGLGLALSQRRWAAAERWLKLLGALASVLSATPATWAAEGQVLPGHVPKAVKLLWFRPELSTI